MGNFSCIKPSKLDKVLSKIEWAYMDWERAVLSELTVRHLGILPPQQIITWWMEGGGVDLPDDYGIESADTERLVHTPWACGFVDVKGGII